MDVTHSLARLLAVPVVDRTRRNHGLEHATLTLLAQRHPHLSLAGRSTPYGFYLYGDVTTAAVAEAAQRALARLRAGEHGLAVHPNCGTNFVVAGCAAAVAAAVGFGGARGWRDRLDRLPVAAALAAVALILAQPLGLILQRDVTTSGVMGALEIVTIDHQQIGRLSVHFVKTRG